MKKMQCEVCGSTEIKKISDDIFECQSCGIQYSKNEIQKLLVEITGNVKIDHSNEVDNNIKRAEQFEKAGNIEKAKEYYNAALDLDATNEYAHDKVKDISQKSEYEKFFVVDAQMTQEETVMSLLREMATTENIVCDIYKEISIKKITNKYNVFALLKGKYKCAWSAIMCYREYEKQTVYKDKYDANTGKYYKEPTTEKVERINRVPSRGEKVFDAEGLVLANNFLKESSDLYGKDTIDILISDFGNLQNYKYATYNVVKLDSSHITEENGKKLYKGIEISFDADGKIVSSYKKRLLEDADKKCADEVQESWDCDYYENLSATRQTLSESVTYVCLPVQIIEYTYKGKDYVAVSDLISKTTTISLTYPCDKELSDKTKEIEELRENTQEASGYSIGGFVLLGVGLLCAILGAISGADDFFVPTTFIASIAGLVLLIVGVFVQKARKKEFDSKETETKKTLFNPRRVVLSAAYTAFFEAYKDIDTLKEVQSQITVDFPKMEIETGIAFAGEFKTFRPVTEEELAAKEIEQENTTTVLQYGIKQLQKKRNVTIFTMLVIGIAFGALGTALLSGCTFWHYTLWALSLILTAGGFGVALIGSLVVMGNKNRKIINYKNSLSAYQQMQSEENLDNDQSHPVFNKKNIDNSIKEIEEIKAEELSKVKITKENFVKCCISTFKEHKKLAFVVFFIIIAFIVAVIGESIYINISVKPYEKALHKNTYVREDIYDNYTTTDKLYFDDDNTYEDVSQNISNETSEVLYSDQESGTFKVRFELFSRTPMVVFNRNNISYRYEIEDFSGEKIYRIDGYYLQEKEQNEAEVKKDDTLSQGSETVDSSSTNKCSNGG